MTSPSVRRSPSSDRVLERVAQHRPHLRRQVVPHALDGQELSAAKGTRGLQSAPVTHQTIRGAVHDQAREFESAQGFAPVLARQDGQRLPHKPLRRGPALEVKSTHGVVNLGLEGKMRGTASDLPKQSDPGLPRLLRRPRSRTEHRLQRFGMRDLREPVAGVRHDRRQRQHPLWVCDRHPLRDHAAHRRAHHMGLRPAERVQHRDRIVGEV